MKRAIILLIFLLLYSCKQDNPVEQPIIVKSIPLPETVTSNQDSLDWGEILIINWKDFIETYYPKSFSVKFKVNVMVQDSLATIMYFTKDLIVIKIPKVPYKPSRLKFVVNDTEYYLPKLFHIIPKGKLVYWSWKYAYSGDTIAFSWSKLSHLVFGKSGKIPRPFLFINQTPTEIIRYSLDSITFVVPQLKKGYYNCFLQCEEYKLSLSDSFLITQPEPAVRILSKPCFAIVECNLPVRGKFERNENNNITANEFDLPNFYYSMAEIIKIYAPIKFVADSIYVFKFSKLESIDGTFHREFSFNISLNQDKPEKLIIYFYYKYGSYENYPYPHWEDNVSKLYVRDVSYKILNDTLTVEINIFFTFSSLEFYHLESKGRQVYDNWNPMYYSEIKTYYTTMSDLFTKWNESTKVLVKIYN